MMALRAVALSPKVGRKAVLSYFRGDRKCLLKQTRALSTSSAGDDRNGKDCRQDFSNIHFDCPPSVEGYQGGEHEFSHNHSLEVLSAAVEYHYVARKSTSVGDKVVEEAVTSVEQGDENGGFSQEYDNSGHVSLSSCMQTTVPEPFTPSGRSPVHLNMPKQGRTLSEQKYIANKLENMHPSRQMSTAAVRNFSSASGAVGNQSVEGEYEAVPCPQGVQGDDCVQFQLWLDSCRRYGLSNCEDQLQGIQTGRKSLAQVLQEQETLIEKIAKEYREQAAANSGDSADSLKFEDLSLDGPCPQGVQGEDCERFKVWFRNCQQFGFGNCAEQLQGIQGGRKTLNQIFKEQDDLIQNISRKYFSTSSPGQVGMGNVRGSRHFSSGPSPPSDPAPADDGSLSQKDKLKRAVKDYGATVVVFHVGISLISLGGFYLLVSSGIDMVAILAKLGVGQSILSSQLLTGASTFVVAYAVHKVFAPARIAITLTSTPFIVRYLRRIGFLKAPKVTKT